MKAFFSRLFVVITILYPSVVLKPVPVYAQAAGSVAGAAGGAVAPSLLPTLPEIPDLRPEWLNASLDQRVKLAEELGEAGARRFAAAKSWEPVLDSADKALRQGFDQVYRSADGMIHVVEAKGGGSPLGTGYGFPQGSPEWAVKAAEATLNSKTATEAEKQAAKIVLEAAAKGKLNVHVIRTEHVLGTPGIPKLESTVKVTPQAMKMAKDILGRLVKAAGVVAKKVAGEAAVATGKTAAVTIGKGIVRAAPAVAVGVEGYTRGSAIYGTETDYREGKITRQQRIENHSGNAVGCAFGIGGAWGGSAGGAALGTAICPGIGTIGGAIIGGAIFYIVGDKAGEAVGRKAAKALQK